MLTVEPLAPRPWIVFAMIGSGNRCENRLDAIEQPRFGALGEVQMRAGIEHHTPPARVADTMLLDLRHCTSQEPSIQARFPSWARLDSNQRPTDYESAALTN